MVAPDHTSRITGQEAIIKAGDQEIAVTNVSFSIDPQSTDVQTDQSMKPTLVTTGLRYSGSFEYDGGQDVIRNLMFYSAGESDYHEAGEPKRVTMTVKEEAPEEGAAGGFPRTWTLEEVQVTGLSRDVPSDDVASSSWDFDCEDAYVSSGGVTGASSR